MNEAWRETADHIIQALQDSSQYRQDIDAVSILSAIVDLEKIPDQSQEVTECFIENALGKDGRMTGILARLIIESAGGDVQLAGARVNAYQEANDIPVDKLRKLRIEIGGEAALDPIMKVLQVNLKDYFQDPIQALNTDTQGMWKTTIKHAQYGFLARILMSVVVFLVGIGLIILAGYQIIFGEFRVEQLVPFASGLGAIVLVIYSGPLKEIRQSVSDLGIASTAFIAYVHRVLEISHTFSFYYLNQQISFDEMEKSSDLIDAAMKETIRMLHPDESRSSEDVIRGMLETLVAPGDEAGDPPQN